MRKSIFLVILGALYSTATFAEEKVFRWSFQGEVNSLDPHSSYETMTLGFQGNIYEALVTRDENLKLVPSLATKWYQVSPKIWRFELRKGVEFHHGNAFNADDVVFSVYRAINGKGEFSVYSTLVEKLEIIDQYTIDWHTPNVDPILPSAIDMLYMMDESWSKGNGCKEVLGSSENAGPCAFKSNGTGPFFLEKRQRDFVTELKRNDSWWGERTGNLTTARFKPIRNDQDRYQALKNGEVDMAYPIPVRLWRHVAENQKFKLLSGNETRTIFLGMDQSRDELLYSNIRGKNPFKDVRVREAFSLAIDVEEINKKIMRGAAKPAGIMIAPQVDGYDESLDTAAEFNMKRAWGLLKDAGYASGFEVVLDCPNDRYINDEKICHMVSSMLAKVGVRVIVNAMPKDKFFKKIIKAGEREYDTSFYLMGWSPSSIDAAGPLKELMACRESKIGSYNVGGYCNKDFDVLVKRILSEADAESRQADITKALSIHKRDYGHIPLHHQPLAWGVRSGVSLVQRADNVFDLKYVKVP